MKTRTRVLLGLVLALGLAATGFAAGTALSAWCCVPRGSGLAGPAIVFGYGLLSAAGGALVGALAAWWLPPAWLRRLALLFGLLGAAVLVLVGKTWLDSRAHTAAYMEQAYANMNAFTIRLDYLDAADDPPWRSAAVDWAQRRYVIERGGERCVVGLDGPAGSTLLRALRAAEGVLYREQYPCAGTLGAVTRRLEWRIAEHDGRDSSGSVALTTACSQAHPALAAPFAALRRLEGDGDLRRHCEVEP